VKRFPNKARKIEAAVRKEQVGRRRQHDDYWSAGIAESTSVICDHEAPVKPSSAAD
jgi:hypothetical protein